MGGFIMHANERPLDVALQIAGIKGTPEDLIGQRFRFICDLADFVPEPDPDDEVLVDGPENGESYTDMVEVLGTILGFAFDAQETVLVISIPATQVGGQVANTISFDVITRRWCIGSYECDQYEEHSSPFTVL